MIYLKNEEEIELLRENNLLVSRTLAEVGRHIRPGVTTKELDRIGEEFIRSHGAVPAFLGYQGYPASLCISVNEQVVHGIPSTSQVLKEGDIVSVDCGTFMKGFVGDSAYTFAVGAVSDEVKQLMEVTKEALYKGTAQARAGNRVGDISAAVQEYAEKFGYGVVRELEGHGLGRKMHEDPGVPNYGARGRGPLLREGMVICGCSSGWPHGGCGGIRTRRMDGAYARSQAGGSLRVRGGCAQGRRGCPDRFQYYRGGN